MKYELRFKGEGYTWQENLSLGFFTSHEKANAFKQNIIRAINKSYPEHVVLQKEVNNIYFMNDYSFETHYEKYIEPLNIKLCKNLYYGNKHLAEDRYYSVIEIEVDKEFSGELLMKILDSRYEEN